MTILELLMRSAIIGIIATATFDLWALLLQLVIGAPAPDWALLGRWIYHFREGKVFHDNIRLSPAAPHEGIIGWLTHYSVGVLFAAVLVVVAGSGWAIKPTFLPALIAGLVTVLFVWCVLMPAFGHGLAASKSPVANRIRAINVVSHAVLGVGYYAGARLVNLLLTVSGVT